MFTNILPRFNCQVIKKKGRIRIQEILQPRIRIPTSIRIDLALVDPDPDPYWDMDKGARKFSKINKQT
jgi:hypothetical protein